MTYLLLLLSLFAASAAYASAAPPVPPVFSLPPPPAYSAPGLAPIPAAAPVSGFQTYGPGIPLAEFLRITLGDTLKRPYILMPEVSASGLLVVADLSHYAQKNPLPLVRELLSGFGLALRGQDGVLFVEKKLVAPVVGDYFVYRPVHRSVSSLSGYFSLFPSLTFSSSAGLSTRATSAPVSPVTRDSSAGAPGLAASSVSFSQPLSDPAFIVARGSLADVASFKLFLAQVDIAVPEVLLHAYVVEVRDAENRDSAVSLVANLLGSRVDFAAGPADTSASGVFRVSGPNLGLAVRSLTADSRVTLLSSPVLRASDGSTATATVGTDTPTLGAIVSQNGSTQQSVSYQSSGVLLSISPRIYAADIHLTISQELSSFVQTTTGLADTPTKLRRAFKSDVIARSGELLLLGGLSESQATSADSSSFVFFGSKSKSSAKSELVVLIQVELL